MQRTSRLFELIQLLRSQSKPITALALAQLLEVSTRTVYRDIATLKSMRTPIDGEAGIGYMMRRGYNLPALNFDEEEIETIVVGLSLISRSGDASLKKAAIRVSAKIDTVRETMDSLQVSNWGVENPDNIELSLLRQAIRQEQILSIQYHDKHQQLTRRTILPIAIIYYIEVIILVAWCEIREDFRHFRVDRIMKCELTSSFFKRQGTNLRNQWQLSQN